jgi:hypothetical protein
LFQKPWSFPVCEKGQYKVWIRWLFFVTLKAYLLHISLSKKYIRHIWNESRVQHIFPEIMTNSVVSVAYRHNIFILVKQKMVKISHEVYFSS